jgi:hypothetical protein
VNTHGSCGSSPPPRRPPQTPLLSPLARPCRARCLAQRRLIASASETSIDRKIRIPWLDDHGGEVTAWFSWSAMPWSGGAEPNSATRAPISTSSVVMLYVKHPVGASTHNEALSGTLLVSGGLGTVLAF